MLSEELKGLLTTCHDKADLPTRAMVDAGLDVLAQNYGLDDITDQEIVRLIWCSMLDELRGGSIRLPFSAVKELL